MTQQYFNRETANVAAFVDNLAANSTENGIFDNASANDFLSQVTNQATNVKIPTKLQAVFDELAENDQVKISKAILDACNIFEKNHGQKPTADIVEQAIHNAYIGTSNARRALSLDSASSDHHDNYSLHPNKPTVAILSTLGAAIDWAHYLPADIKSNEARLAIITHEAGAKSGTYGVNSSLDGAQSGGVYLSSNRTNTTKTDANGKTKGKITAIQLNREQCDPNGGDLKILSGRTLIYQNGVKVAGEVNASKDGKSSISGKINLSGNYHILSGVINLDNGDYELSSEPKLPAGIELVVEAFIDFERAPEFTPTIISSVNTYSLFANPWRATTHQTIDSSTQMDNELGLDAQSEAIIAINAQFANERHYEALAKGMRLAKNNNTTFDYAKAAANNYNGRSSVWQDLAYPLGALSAQMAIDTFDHGITHLYVGKNVAAQLLAMPDFEPSGLPPRPGIFRLGRLFGQYEVYFTPHIVREEANAAQILAIGRGSDVTRNPIVLGDAVPPTLMPLSLNSDMKRGVGFYARNFTAVNPHEAFSRGFALINVINM